MLIFAICYTYIHSPLQPDIILTSAGIASSAWAVSYYISKKYYTVSVLQRYLLALEVTPTKSCTYHM